MSTSAVLPSVARVQVAGYLFRWLTRGTVLLADFISLAMAGTLAVFTRYLFHAEFTPHDYIGFAPCILIFFLVFAYCGLYPGLGCSPIEEFRLILRASSISFLLLLGTSFFLREGLLSSRIVFALAWVLTILLVPFNRRLLRGICSTQPWWGIPTVILGEQKAGRMMLELLRGHRRLGLRPIAFLHDPSDVFDDLHDVGKLFVGDLSHAKRLARENKGCYVVIAMPTVGSDRLRAIYNEHINTYQNVLIVPDLFGMRSLSVTAGDICGILTLKLSQKLTLAFPRFCKRSFDLVVAGTFSLVLLPLFILLCIAIRMSSKGSIFYGQQRVGKNQNYFTVWKFRSMVVNADAVLESHLANDPRLREEWMLDHKLKVDPRVTPIGRLLRRISLDELPQLWNILCGDMSLVGPRPIVESEIEKYGVNFDQYSQVIPGLTGLWQISGRNDTTYDLRIRMDDYYVRNWSLSLDTYILLRTLKTVLFSEGAY